MLPALRSAARRVGRLSDSMLNNPTLPNIVLGGVAGSWIGSSPHLWEWVGVYLLTLGVYVFGREIDRALDFEDK